MLLHQTTLANRAAMIVDVCGRVVLPRAVEHSNELICLAYANFSRLTAVS